MHTSTPTRTLLYTFFTLLLHLTSTTAAATPPTTTPNTNILAVRSLNTLPLAPLIWTGQIEQNGPNVTITGTHKEVAEKIKALKPYWQTNATHAEMLRRDLWRRIEEVKKSGGEEAYTMQQAGANSTGELEERSNRVSFGVHLFSFSLPPFHSNISPYYREAEYDETSAKKEYKANPPTQNPQVAYYCMQSAYKSTQCQAIEYDIDWFSSTYGGGTCGTTANTCARMACEWDSAVLLCNSAPGGNLVVGCATVAQNMYFVLNACLSTNVYNSYCKVEGQSFYINPTYNVLLKQTDAGKGC